MRRENIMELQPLPLNVPTISSFKLVAQNTIFLLFPLHLSLPLPLGRYRKEDV